MPLSPSARTASSEKRPSRSFAAACGAITFDAISLARARAVSLFIAPLPTGQPYARRRVCAAERTVRRELAVEANPFPAHLRGDGPQGLEQPDLRRDCLRPAATPFLLGEEVVVRVDDEQCGRVLLVDGGRYGGLLRTLDRQRRGAQRLSARRRRRRPGGRRRPWRPLRKDSGLVDAPRRRVVGAGRRAKYPHCPGCY